MRAGARLSRLEAQVRQQRAALEVRNTERVQAALDQMTVADLHRLRDALQPWPCPWADVLPGLPEDVRAAWAWAQDMDNVTRAQVWPLPPAGAAGIFEGEAAKREAADPARLAWLLLSKLAEVIEAEV